MATKGLTGITNLFLYNRFVNDINDDFTTDISDTETLRYIIDQTNDQIAQKCGRTFANTTYKEWVRGEGTKYLILGNYPITNIKLVSASAIDVCTIEGTGFEVATVSSNNSSMVLSSIDSSGTEVETVLNYSDYANVTSLVTAIDLVSGWDGEVLSDKGTSLTQLIRPIDSGWALDEKQYMSTPYLGNSIRISKDSDSTIETECSGAFYGDVFVWYTAGYTLPVCDEVGGTLTTVGNVPEGLTLVANQIIKDIVDGIGEDKNMKSEKMGDYSYMRDGINSAIDRHWKELSQYSRKLF